MSDTPQNDSVDSDVIEPVIENNDSIVDSETTEHAQVESNEQVDEDAAKQAAIQKTINQKHFETKQAERERDAANVRIAEFETKERERQAQAVGNIPEEPDPFDDDYSEKQAAYIKAIREKATFDANQSAYNQQQQNQQQQAQQAQAVEFNKSVNTYSNRATELGIGADELQQAANVVGNYGLSDDLIKHIISDPDGPLITKHLAANPMEAHELASMSPYAIGSKLDAIKSSAAALKPKHSNTPAPIDGVKGNGVTPGDKYKNISGAKFE